jgi:hypothetical protein
MKQPKVFGLVSLVASLLVCGCKDDPPPPPIATVPASAQADPAAGKGKANKHRLDAVRRSNKVPRLKPETTKRYRTQTCYFGAHGIALARDAYLSSLAGGQPGPSKVPSFGDYPEHAKLREHFKAKGRKTAFLGRGLPFVRHVRSCAIAKTIDKGKNSSLDAATSRLDSYVSPLNKSLMEAHRYYARKEYERDGFAKGKVLHGQLTKAFAQLDAELEAFGKVAAPWMRGLGPVPQKLDEGGKIAAKAVAQARTLTLEVLALDATAPAATKAGIEAGLQALSLTRDELQKRQTAAAGEPHPRVVMPRLASFVAAATELSKKLASGTKLDAAARYPVTSAMAALIEANHRAHTHLLRRAAGAGPMRMLKPPMHHIGRTGRPITTRAQPATTTAATAKAAP